MKHIDIYKLTSSAGWAFFLDEPATKLTAGELTLQKALGKSMLTPYPKGIGVSFCFFKRGAHL
ncbi:MAG: hypothetical protein P9M07_08990 [Candidatus Aceula meridiana]|nr:hypothetical protein [Candidatus Aceula meridiana]